MLGTPIQRNQRKIVGLNIFFLPKRVKQLFSAEILLELIVINDFLYWPTGETIENDKSFLGRVPLIFFFFLFTLYLILELEWDI